MEYPPVLSKSEFCTRYVAGEFGNASPSWHTLEEFVKRPRAGMGGKFHLRNRTASDVTYYNVSADEVLTLWRGVERPDLWYCSEMAPHHRGTIQGEVMQSLTGAGVDLLYTSAQLPMREALALKSTQVSGILALSILREAMDPNSYDWLQVLLDRYERHVVEFTCFEIPWGTLWPNFNTVFWEVRKY